MKENALERPLVYGLNFTGIIASNESMWGVIITIIFVLNLLGAIFHSSEAFWPFNVVEAYVCHLFSEWENTLNVKWNVAGVLWRCNIMCEKKQQQQHGTYHVLWVVEHIEWQTSERF